jgi:hypothetical protein
MHRRVGEWTESDGRPQLIMKYQTCGQRSQGMLLKLLLDC